MYRTCLGIGWGIFSIFGVLAIRCSSGWRCNQLQRLIYTGRTGHWLHHSEDHCLIRSEGNHQIKRNVANECSGWVGKSCISLQCHASMLSKSFCIGNVYWARHKPDIRGIFCSCLHSYYKIHILQSKQILGCCHWLCIWVQPCCLGKFSFNLRSLALWFPSLCFIMKIRRFGNSGSTAPIIDRVLPPVRI